MSLLSDCDHSIFFRSSVKPLYSNLVWINSLLSLLREKM